MKLIITFFIAIAIIFVFSVLFYGFQYLFWLIPHKIRHKKAIEAAHAEWKRKDRLYEFIGD